MHTQAPWIIRNMSDTTTSKQAFSERYTIEVCRDGLRSVLADLLEVNMCPEHGGTALANAEFIVQAVNEYDALKTENVRLREALEHVLEASEHGGDMNDISWGLLRAALKGVS